jgi:hypothetical protein
MHAIAMPARRKTRVAIDAESLGKFPVMDGMYMRESKTSSQNVDDHTGIHWKSVEFHGLSLDGFGGDCC